MQPDDNSDNRGDDGSGHRPSTYRNDPPNKNTVSFELTGDDLDDEGYFQRLGRVRSPGQVEASRRLQMALRQWSRFRSADG
jgi:hypothetical protein